MERKNSPFVEYWLANPSHWFTKSDDVDTVVTEKFEGMLQNGDTCILGNIILYDQVPRHIYRKEQASHIISFFLEKALSFTNLLKLSSLTDLEWAFATLPFRHKGTNLQYVLQTAWSRYEKSGSKIIRRYIKATYDRLPLAYNIKYFEPAQFSFPIFNCDRFADVLEFNPGVRTHLRNDLKSLLLDLPNDIVISLSGGVDSMVCLDMLHRLRIKNVTAVHVNYGNRGQENIVEEEFVKAWCDYLGIDIYVVRTNEINREQCMRHKLRDMYEQYTRKKRFYGYNVAMKNPFVMLGHNKDDVLENVFTNIANHTKYNNLYGMSPISCEDDITFYRPLLAITKDEIIKYARLYNIPYLKNSTPVWSQRGQIRNSVVPVLTKWNPKIIDGLYRLSKEMSDLNDIVDKMVENIDYDRLPKTKSVYFWQKVFGKTVSQKSIDNFIKRIHSTMGHFKVVLKKDFVAQGVSYDTHISLEKKNIKNI